MKSKKSTPKKAVKAPDDFGNKFWKNNFLPASIIFLLGIILYSQTFSFKYALDDKMIITENVFTNQGLDGIGKIFSEESFTGYFKQQQNLVEGSRYRPLSMATFAIENHFFKQPRDDGYGNLVKDANGNQLYSGNPAISHVLNAIFYSLTGLLLFRILFLGFPGSSKKKWYWTIPFWAAIIFLVHPIHTEVVANIKSRDEIFSLMFSLAAIYFMQRYFQVRKKRFLLLTAVSFFLALLSKESAFAFLFIIPLTSFYFNKVKRKDVWVSSVPLIIITAVYLIIRHKVIGHFINKADEANLMNNPFYGTSFSEKSATIIYTLGYYVKLLFWPYPLTSDYYPYEIPIMNFGNWKVILSLLIYVLLGFIAVRGITRKSIPSYSILFYFTGLLLISNIFFTIGTFMNERFLYISSVAFSILIAFMLIEKLPGMFPGYFKNIRMTGISILIAMTIIFSFITIDRLPAWEDNYSLFENDVKTSSNSAFSNCFAGVGLYYKFLQSKDDSIKKELLKNGEAYERKSLSIYPVYDEALHNLSGIVVKQFDYDKDVNKLLNNFTEILIKKNKSDYIDSYLLFMNGQPNYSSEMIKFYHKLGYELFFRQERKNEKARKYIEMGLQIDPTNSVLNRDLREIETGVPAHWVN